MKLKHFFYLLVLCCLSVVKGFSQPPAPGPPAPPSIPIDNWTPVFVLIALFYGSYKITKKVLLKNRTTK
jgi:hypothetical protein